ncbi:MAG TPA: inositol 2-dehydrogenase [Anaerolineae bacterium]|nr:inositol 2-dehydrogenase [Anaerolineae bacterium]
MTIHIGLIGTGRIGRLHAANLARHVPGAHLAAVVDVNRASAEQAAREFNVPLVFENIQDLISRPEIDAVVICSSTDTHAPFIIAAARAGKHIFCEKPIALNLPSIDTALQAVAAHGVKLMVGFNRRYHSNFKKIRELIAAGKIGRPYLVRITSHDSKPPPIEYVKVSGGIFLDMTIHDFDMARYLLGDEVTELYATGNVLVDPAIGAAGDVDTAVVVMRYVNGAICTIENSRQAVYGYDQRVEVLGSEGALSSSNEYPDSVTHHARDGVHSSPTYFGFTDLYADTYIAEMTAFVDSIEKNTEPPVTGKDGRVPLVMGLAATRSLREHRPVRLDEIQ